MSMPHASNAADAAANVDEREVENFASLSARWWEPHGEMRPLHAINPLRAQFVADHVNLAGARALDVGCGGGLLSEALARAGARVIGIDASASQVGAARAHAEQGGLDIDYRATTSGALLHEGTAPFDVVTCMEVVEHVPDFALLVNECAQLCRPGGHVFFSTINRTPRAFALAVLGAEYVLGLLPRGTHDYERFVKPSELDAAARRAGLALRQLRGLRYAPLSGRHALTPDVSVNYVACFECGA